MSAAEAMAMSTVAVNYEGAALSAQAVTVTTGAEGVAMSTVGVGWMATSVPVRAAVSAAVAVATRATGAA
eukprot:scaffold36478_cov101-Isochrysis_galbana.AAC.1